MRSFCDRHSTDPLARVAQAYLAILALDRGDEAEARRLVGGLSNGPRGNTADFGKLVEGVALARHGSAEAALGRLTPLVGKLIDPFAQDLLHESVVEAAVQARRWVMAVQTMNEWLMSLPEAQLGPVRARVNTLLQRFPAAELERALRAVQLDRDREVWGKEIREALATRLARIAMEREDPRLARSVLETSRAVIEMDEGGTSLAALAASGGDMPRVSGARVGLVIPTSSDRLRRRGSEALAGALEVFRPHPDEEYVPGAPADEPPVLVVREASGEPDALGEAFRSLESEGVAMVLTGFDAQQAAQAAAIADDKGLPVVLLTSPMAHKSASPHVFVLGEPEAAWSSESPLAQAASARGHAKTARVALGAPHQGALGETCPDRPESPIEARFPLKAWHDRGVTAILVDGPAWCAKDLLRALGTTRFRPSVFLGLEALGVTASAPYPGEVLQAGAGVMGGGGQPSNEAVRTWRATHGADPSWFEALGRDAALLAQRAVSRLPGDTTAQGSEVMARRQRAQELLAHAEVSLWTTTARGFAGRNVIARAVELRDKAP